MFSAEYVEDARKAKDSFQRYSGSTEQPWGRRMSGEGTKSYCNSPLTDHHH